jgi:hypothetical protein
MNAAARVKVGADPSHKSCSGQPEPGRTFKDESVKQGRARATEWRLSLCRADVPRSFAGKCRGGVLSGWAVTLSLWSLEFAINNAALPLCSGYTPFKSH